LRTLDGALFVQAHPGYREQPRRHEHGDHPRKTPRGL